MGLKVAPLNVDLSFVRAVGDQEILHFSLLVFFLKINNSNNIYQNIANIYTKNK